MSITITKLPISNGLLIKSSFPLTKKRTPNDLNCADVSLNNIHPSIH